MWLLNKNNKQISSRRQIQIKEVRNGIIIFPNNKYRMIIETSSVNFELKSDEEQDVLLESFQNFLNSLVSPLQILIRVREVDVTAYLEKIEKYKQTEKLNIYKDQIDNYANFIRQVISGNKILTRKFYIVIPYETKEKDFSLITEQMNLKKDLVLRGLEKLGMKASCLNTLEVLNQFYAFYNPDQAKTQELKKQSIEMFLEDKYA